MPEDDKISKRERYMAAAIRLARRNLGKTGTNPSVGCLIVTETDAGHTRTIGRGVTAPGGRPHAETVALAQAGDAAENADLYVSLEPCSHFGQTSPCVDAISHAKVGKVHCAILDPDVRVAGNGIQTLQRNGIDLSQGQCSELATWDLRKYLASRIRTRPWVTMKLAMTADGFIGLAGEGQVAITGSIANAQTHLLRATHNAIMVGAGTFKADNPSLSCRLRGLEHRSPQRIIVGGADGMNMNARVFCDGGAKTYWINDHQAFISDSGNPMASNVQRLQCSRTNTGLDLGLMLGRLYDHGIHSILLEAGQKLGQSFIRSNLIDEMVLYINRRKLADFPVAKNNAHWVKNPLGDELIPPGFTMVRQSQFGPDKALNIVNKQSLAEIGARF